MDPDDYELHVLNHGDEQGVRSKELGQKGNPIVQWLLAGHRAQQGAGRDKLMAVSVSLGSVHALYYCSDTQAWFLESMKHEKWWLDLLDMPV